MIQKVLSGLGALLLSGVAGAQSLSVPLDFASGESVEIGYENAARPNETIIVTVRVYDVGPHQVIEVPIVLDRNGKGNASWVAPSGMSVTFNAPAVRQLTRFL